MDECVFCQIVKGEEPASVVYADEKVLAVMDTTPVNPGHVLVIPKHHSSCLAGLNPATGAHMFKVAMRIAEGLRRSSVTCEGVNLFLADGEAASQDIFHVHLHVIPRFSGDGFKVTLDPNYGHQPRREVLDKTAQKIREAMEPH